MKQLQPLIVEVLDAFFQRETELRSVPLIRRYQRVRDHLEAYLEEESERILVTDDIALLRAERELDPHRAFVRTMHADDLLYALPGFLQAERMLPVTIDARAQVKLTAGLAQWIVNRRLIDAHENSCVLLDLGYEIRQERLRQRAAAT